MKLTRIKKKKYLAECGNKCPYCRSANIVGHRTQTDSSSAWQKVTCSDCGKEWNDVYTLVDIEEI